MKTREEIQFKAVNLFKEHHYLVLEWATGLGKTKTAIDCIKTLPKNSKILLLIAELAHKQNWTDEFHKWKVKVPYTISTYASLKNLKDTKWDLIIMDEGHHSNTDIRLDTLSTIQSNNVLILSATLPKDTIFQLGQIFKPFYTFTFTLDEAILNNIIPEPKVYLVPIAMDNKKNDQKIIESWGTAKKLIKCKYQDRWEYLSHKDKYPDTKLVITCTALQKYTYLTQQAEFYKKRYNRFHRPWDRNLWMQAGSTRKRFMGDIKTEVAYKIIKKLKNKKYICFCSSIDQAEALGGRYCIHSKKKNVQSIIDKFNNNTIHQLYAVGMLQEGQNLSGIQAGIIIQLDGKERAFIQKFGRTLRSDSPEQYIIYFPSTRDEEYKNMAISLINPNYIKTVTKYLNED